MPVYNNEQKKEIFSHILAKLNTALDCENPEVDVSIIWKNILFLLDYYNSEEFFGVLSIKILGQRMWDIKEEERTYKLAAHYLDIEKKIEKM